MVIGVTQIYQNFGRMTFSLGPSNSKPNSEQAECIKIEYITVATEQLDKCLGARDTGPSVADAPLTSVQRFVRWTPCILTHVSVSGLQLW